MKSEENPWYKQIDESLDSETILEAKDELKKLYVK